MLLPSGDSQCTAQQPRTFRPMRFMKNSSCSLTGSTSGPSVVMLAFRLSPAIAIRLLLSATPTCCAHSNLSAAFKSRTCCSHIRVLAAIAGQARGNHSLCKVDISVGHLCMWTGVQHDSAVLPSTCACVKGTYVKHDRNAPLRTLPVLSSFWTTQP